jgi:CRISPR-associated protein Csb1
VQDEEKTVKVNLLDIGHRIADGAVRFSELRDEVTKAIVAMREDRNAEPLTRLAPTSLVFGFWDSRPDTTMFKCGRLLRSEIRATNVAYVKRSAQFNPAFDPTLVGLADELPEDADQQQSSDEGSGKAGDGKDPLSKLGLRAAPAVNTHGGIRVYGQITRRTQINLVNLRSLAVVNRIQNGKTLEIDREGTLKLRRYILGLAMVAARCQSNYALREGCLLVGKREPEAHLVYSDCKSQDLVWDRRHVFAYAQKAAREFGIDPSPRSFEFDGKRARTEVERLKKEKGKSKKSR